MAMEVVVVVVVVVVDVVVVVVVVVLHDTSGRCVYPQRLVINWQGGPTPGTDLASAPPSPWPLCLTPKALKNHRIASRDPRSPALQRVKLVQCSKLRQNKAF